MFAAIIIFFFLPFISLSCNTQRISINGIDLVTGINAAQRTGGQAGQQFAQQSSTLVEAVLALGAAILGLIVSLGQRKAIAAIAGGIGAACLLWMKIRLDRDLLSSGYAGAVRLDYELGFWLALLFFIGVAVLNGWYILQPSDGETG